MDTQRGMLVGVLAALLTTAAAGAADVWDRAADDDNGAHTDNGLTHGSDQLHDLAAESGVADQDWGAITSVARSSYEVIVDGTTGDLDLGPSDVVRVAADGATVVQQSTSLAGGSRALRWQNTGSTSETNWIRVSGGACTTDCGADDVYRLRAYETTYAVPRFNNTGSQVSVFMVTSLAPFRCSATFYFYNNSASLLGSTTTNYEPRQSFVVNTMTLPFANGQSGSAVIAHTCGYGNLAGKAVSLEPTTGFSFDTPIVPKFH